MSVALTRRRVRLRIAPGVRLEPPAPYRLHQRRQSALLTSPLEYHVEILDLHHDESGTILHMLVGGVTLENDWPYSRVVRPLPVLWIQDSSARWHTTQAYGTSRLGGNGEIVLWLDIMPPLERGTTWVDIVAAGQSAEVRATLPLHWK